MTVSQYTHMRYLPIVGWCGVYKLFFHWTMHYGIDDLSYYGRYCFETQDMAVEAMSLWTGEGDPLNWHKHPPSGRRRDNLTGVIWHESEIKPKGVL